MARSHTSRQAHRGWPKGNPEIGYAWSEGQDGTPWLVEAEPPGGWWRTHPLTESPALFRAFAELEPTQEAVLAFANAHGWLGVPKPTAEGPAAAVAASFRARGVPFRSEGIGDAALGEPLARWTNEIRHLAEAVEMLDAARQDNPELSRWVRLSEHGALYLRRERGHLERIEEPEELATYATRSRAQAARLFVQRWANERLAEHAAPRVLFNPDRRECEIHITPKNLLGALWLQLAQALEGGRDYRRCATCRSWFSVAPELNRSDRLYCSERCRAKAYRQRKEQARAMRVGGLAPSTIARRLGTDTKTVRGWLGEKPRRKGRK